MNQDQQWTRENLRHATRLASLHSGAPGAFPDAEVREGVARDPALKAFCQRQESTDQQLRESLARVVARQVPENLHARLQSTLVEHASAVNTVHTSNIQPRVRRPSGPIRLVPALWPVMVAALVLVAVGIAAVLVTPLPNASPLSGAADTYAEVRPEFVRIYTQMIAAGGLHDFSRVKEHSHQISYSGALPEQIRPEGWPALEPINIRTGEIKGLRYTAICFCSGNIATEKPYDPLSIRVARVVLFVLDTEFVPVGVHPDEQGVWVDESATGCVAAGWVAGGKTCVAMMCAGTSQNESRKLAMPLRTLEF